MPDPLVQAGVPKFWAPPLCCWPGGKLPPPKKNTPGKNMEIKCNMFMLPESDLGMSGRSGNDTLVFGQTNMVEDTAFHPECSPLTSPLSAHVGMLRLFSGFLPTPGKFSPHPLPAGPRDLTTLVGSGWGCEILCPQ